MNVEKCQKCGIDHEGIFCPLGAISIMTVNSRKHRNSMDLKDIYYRDIIIPEVLAARDKLLFGKMEEFIQDYYRLSTGLFKKKYTYLDINKTGETIFLGYLQKLRSTLEFKNYLHWS